MQEQFAKLMSRCERLCAVQRESLRQYKIIFESLLHNAFKTQLSTGTSGVC